MRTVVKFHTSVFGRVARWRHSFHSEKALSVTISDTYLQSFVTEVTNPVNGVGANCQPDGSTVPPTYWYEISNGTWLRYVVIESRVSLLGPRQRLILVVQFG